MSAPTGFLRASFTVARREAVALFGSPIAWLALAAVTLAMSLAFFDNLRAYNAEVAVMQAQLMLADLLTGDIPPDLNLVDRVIHPTVVQTAYALLGVVPLVTMGVFCEERSRRTGEILYTLPLSDAAIVTGKFLATWLLLAAMIALTAMLPAVAVAQTGLAAGEVLASVAGLLLFAFALAAIGLTCSALAANQLLAAIIAFAISSALFDLGWLLQLTGETVGRALAALSLHPHLMPFTRGSVAAADVAFFAAWCLGGLLVTISILDLERLR